VVNEFILHSDHEALKYIQGQHKLNVHHAKRVEYLQTFNLTIKQKSEKLNKVRCPSKKVPIVISTWSSCAWF